MGLQIGWSEATTYPSNHQRAHPPSTTPSSQISQPWRSVGLFVAALWPQGPLFWYRNGEISKLGGGWSRGVCSFLFWSSWFRCFFPDFLNHVFWVIFWVNSNMAWCETPTWSSIGYSPYCLFTPKNWGKCHTWIVPRGHEFHPRNRGEKAWFFQAFF